MSATDQTVFIVDDDDCSRHSVDALVSTMSFARRLFDSAESFLDFYDGEPGCLISDLRLPGLDVVELLDTLHSQGQLIPTIVISGYADVAVVVEVMRRGAITMLEKPYREHELWNAIRAGLKQDEKSRHESAERKRIRMRLSTLTDDERGVMELMIDGVPNKAISHRLDLGLRTVESHRRMVFRKMHVESVAHLVQDVFVSSGSRRLTADDYCV